MPSKHINSETWEMIEREAVLTVCATKHIVKDTEMMNILIREGIKVFHEMDKQRKLDLVSDCVG